MKKENEKRILSAARSILSQKGNAASVREIANTSGLSHPALRKKWPTRESLFTAVNQDINRDVEEALGTPPEGETLSHLLVKSMFALQKVPDAALYYTQTSLPDFPMPQEVSPILTRLVSVCDTYLKERPYMASKYGVPLIFDSPKIMAATIFNLLISFRPDSMSRVCRSLGTDEGVSTQLPLVFLSALAQLVSANAPER